MDTYLISLVVSFLACAALTPLVIRLAHRLRLVDDAAASHRKVHVTDIPRLGGVAIVVAFFVPIVALSVYKTGVGAALLEDAKHTTGLLGGALIIALLGLYDDLKGAKPRVKFAVQLGVAIGLCSLGFVIDRINLPLMPVIELGWFGYLLTIVWIVGVTNAVNLIDGLDGLAAGVAVFALAPVLVLAVSKGSVVLALICCCLLGSLLGFLVFNFHPARIFMGDTGSMFLGFTLAVVTVDTAYKGKVAVAMLTPILALGLPILDTLLAIARRAFLGRSLFVGDKQHIHHRLLDSGLSHRNTVLVMYGFSAVFAALALAMHFNRDRESALLFVVSLLVAGILLRKVGYLALPSLSGDGIGQADAIRDRNRLVRRALPDLASRLETSERLDALLATTSELAWIAGAAAAELDLRASRPESPIRTWKWDTVPDDDLETVAFALKDAAGTLMGTLTIHWPKSGVFHDALVPEIEAGCDKLAARLRVALPAHTAPAGTSTA